MREYVSAATVHGRVFGRALAIRTDDEHVGFDWPLPNVWLGTSVENARWRTRIDELRQTPAAVRFLSCEPLLGPLTIRVIRALGDGEVLTVDDVVKAKGLDLTGIDWVIVGGESGDGARPMDPDWVRAIIAECRKQGAAPYIKQLGQRWSVSNLGHSGHAGNPDEWPEDLRVREYPTTVGQMDMALSS
jgi:protein gp37